MAGETRRGNLVLFAAALAANLAFDALLEAGEALAPPHLLIRYAPDFVSHMVTPLGMSLAASPVLAAIAVLLLGVVPRQASRRALRLAAWLGGFWVLAEGLLALVWLSAPGPLLAGAVAFGLLRSYAVAVLLVRLDGGKAEPRR